MALAGCSRSAHPDATEQADMSSAAASDTALYVASMPGKINADLSVARNDDSCDVDIAIHNLSPNDLNAANLSIPGVDGKFTLSAVAANADGDVQQSIPVAGKSCMKLAKTIAQQIAANAVSIDSCQASGVADADCRKLFVFHAATDENALQQQINALKTANIAVGDYMRGGDSMTFYADLKKTDPSTCYDHNITTKVADVHLDDDGVADAYKTSLDCSDVHAYAGWVSRWDVKPNIPGQP